MGRPRFGRLLAVGLTFVGAFTPLLELGPAGAQSPPASPEVARSPVASPSLAMAPEPDLSGFAVPADGDLVADAGLDVPPTLPTDADLSPDSIVQRAAAIVAATDASEWSLGSLAERLQYSPQAAFALVRDSIGYDPYPGVLRGGLGTLLARAGNDVDRALLLQALLDRMVVRTRLVEGTLDDATLAALLHRAFQPPVAPLGPQPIDPAELVDLPSLSARAHRDYGLLRAAIGDRDASMSGASDAAAASESRQHVWLQMQFGTGWLDLDPSMPDAQPGQTLAVATTVLDSVPAAWRDTVTVQVIAERLSDGVLSDATVLDHQLDAATVARQDVFLGMAPVGDSIGESINQALGSGAGWRPILYVGNDTVQGDPFPVVPETDIFEGTQSGAEVSALRLQVTVAVPGSEPEVITRTLLDRLSLAARGSASIARTELTPFTMRDHIPLELSGVLHLEVSTGGFDARAHQIWRQIAARFSELLVDDPTRAAEYGFPAMIIPMTVADESLVLASERLIDEGLDRSPGVRTFIDRPRVFITRVDASPTQGRISTGVDLLTDGVRVLTDVGGDAVQAAHARLWYGALQGALESQFLLSRIRAGGMSDGQLHGVSFDATSQPRLLSPNDPADPAAGDALTRDLGAGLLAVLPGQAAGSESWWAVDPTTGATRAVLDPGSGGTEYTNAVTNTAGRIFADPSKVPQTEAELQQLYRQALAQVEGAGRPPPVRTCIGGNEYGSLVCNILIYGSVIVLVGLTVAIIAWFI